MEPTYLDIHIHTSNDPDNLNQHYDVNLLFEKVKSAAQNCSALISFTDHNSINKTVYLAPPTEGINVLLGAELHIKNYDEAPAYHCHILFKDTISENTIDTINTILDDLYPRKQVERTDPSIPKLETIIKKFDKFDFILLPHGGQSHCTFNESIPAGVVFDSTMERSIYYNQFDGFTARGNEGLESTIDYFNRLGINEFVNLVTCSDNYEPSKYPMAKSSNAKPFIPTWMYAQPTFDGLRLSLSESTRFYYSLIKPSGWAEYISKVSLREEKIDIDIEFTPGLNVVIGGSSSGKTLLVDSVYRKIASKSFDDSPYNALFNVDKINIVNPSAIIPHFLSQNYIMKIVDAEASAKIDDIDIIKNVFPTDRSLIESVDHGIAKLRSDISTLIGCVEDIEKEMNILKTIPQIARLFTRQKVQKNLYLSLQPTPVERSRLVYYESSYNSHATTLTAIKKFLQEHPFATELNAEIELIIAELQWLHTIYNIEQNVYKLISSAKTNFDNELKSNNIEDQTKNQEFQKLLESITRYVVLNKKFERILNEISTYSMRFDSQEIISMGHHLYIQNQFELSKQKVVEIFNGLLKTGETIPDFNQIEPSRLFKIHYRQRGPKVDSYKDFIDRVCQRFVEGNKTVYKIQTKEGRDFDSLSAGWKTSVLLDLILGYDHDIAPIIIDQPEDNLATSYINHGLVDAIKNIKHKKQIILVSHNATIPMMADAQNIVYCQNIDSKIYIRSSRLEGCIDEKAVLDIIADITDGGKSAIKKRVKKYNLKKFK